MPAVAVRVIVLPFSFCTEEGDKTKRSTWGGGRGKGCKGYLQRAIAHKLRGPFIVNYTSALCEGLKLYQMHALKYHGPFSVAHVLLRPYGACCT